MDPLTHLILTRLCIGRTPAILAAGVLPDAPFYLTYPAWLIKRGQLRTSVQVDTWPDAPRWMVVPHCVTHSLPVLITIAALARTCTGTWPHWALAWALHILIDIPTHGRGQWAPQVLWPFFTATFPGRSWTHLLVVVLRRLL